MNSRTDTAAERLPDVSTELRWGVIGTGGIAAAFTDDLALLPNAAVVAVGSRRAATAREFARAHGVPRAHGSYADLVADREVDAVYVATPHPGHHGPALAALRAGKAVLVEKPFTLNAAQARELVEAAAAHGSFLMEAMWTRFLPAFVRIREILAAGALGEIITVQADHGQRFAFDPGHRLFAPELGGGALLDLGVYPVSLASMVLGTPERVTALSDPAPTGVDAQTSILLRHPGGRHAVLTTTLAAAGPNRATIVGTQARIEIDRTWYSTSGFTVIDAAGRVVERWEQQRDGRGLRFQAAEVTRCLDLGLAESPVLPWAETVSIMETLDEVRRQIGLRYPGE